jgi:alkyldihydroxyacetonephosphate synthase
MDVTVRERWTTEHAALPASALNWLARRTGLRPVQHNAPALHSVRSSALPVEAAAALEAVVGEPYVQTDVSARAGHSGGLSYLDLLRHRESAELTAPDAVVLPASHDEVQRVLEVCVEHGIGVVPFGGGTSVVGGVSALRGDKAAVLALDLGRLASVVAIDPTSRLATLQAGMSGPEAERLLADHDFTLGHFPQSFERATIGGFAATRSAGQASSGYGRFEDMVAGIRLATPKGEWRLGVAPASAAGPDLRALVLGSEGLFGVITEVTLRVRPKPVLRRYVGYLLDGWERGTCVLRELAQSRHLADVTRLSDVDETDVSLALGGWQGDRLRDYARLRGIAEPCLLITGWDTSGKRELAARRAAARPVLRRHRAISLGTLAGKSWEHGRYAGPRQRDTLLDNGVCVETLETATHWSHLSELRSAVRTALADSLTTERRTPVIMCHISHAYETGASLYFTVLVPRDPADPFGQWQRAKQAACAAIVDGPLGTISHHHAVGVDHAPYLAGEIGEIGIEVLTAVKQTLDPTGILNPGKLISRS